MSEMDMEEPEFKAKQLRFEYSTSDLIAELEKRRPCERCDWKEYRGSVEICNLCIWSMTFQDNFKEATK